MRKMYLVLMAIVLSLSGLSAQELRCKVTVNGQQLTSVDPKVFKDMEQAITEFMNGQKWTNDVFEDDERIDCSLIITISDQSGPDTYKGEVAIQSTRPIYGSSQTTPLLNHLDKNVIIPYQQFQPIIFNENSYSDNLSAVLAYYGYLIIGLDYDSFSRMGGQKYFQKAQDIINAIPSGSSDVGWEAASNNKNRYWLIENLLSPRMRGYREGMYDYHRQGLDVAYKDVNTARAVMASVFDKLKEANRAYPNSMLLNVFTLTKRSEIVQIFINGTIPQQNKVISVMSQISPIHANQFREIKTGVK